MPIVVEDGTIVSGANSYVSVRDADAYHAARGNAAWSAGDAAQVSEIVWGDVAPAPGYVYGVTVDSEECSYEAQTGDGWTEVLDGLGSAIEVQSGGAILAAQDPDVRALMLHAAQVNTPFALSSAYVVDELGSAVADAGPENAYQTPEVAAGSDAPKEAAILRAMAWLEVRPWKGRKTAYTNPLQWPRADVVDRDGYLVPSDEVPQQVVSALCEAALVEFTESGALAPTLERGGMVASETVDVISTSYFPGAPAQTQYHAVTQYLGDLVRGGGSVRLERG